MSCLTKNLSASTPGRICFFGEHQDYLGLPVIAAGISRRVHLNGTSRTDKKINLSLPDIQQIESLTLDFPIAYTHKRDYYRSALNVMYRKGYRFHSGFDITVRGNIPINSGTSSSSALLVTWVHFLSKAADEKPYSSLSLAQLAEIAFEAEVLEFREPGGRMDQYATALGQVLYLESMPAISVQTYLPKLGTFVLGDSLEPKDTLRILKHVKWGMLTILNKLQQYDLSFNLNEVKITDLERYQSLLDANQFMLLKANISDRDILQEAKRMLETSNWDDKLFGQLLTQHQTNLREAKKISTPKINRMIDAALNAGAWGAKINGSGGGGCMFAYAPDAAQEVAEAIEKQGGKAYIITISEGSKIEINE